jgi:putative addiction module component (TIGR02574 family)
VWRRVDKTIVWEQYFFMTTADIMRKEIMTLSASERASLAHDIILSLDDPSDYDLSSSQEQEIQRRLKMVRDGLGSGRPATEVFADIKGHYS